MKENKQWIWNTLSISSFIVSGVMIYKGYDKIHNYINIQGTGENAYVGGDAYNYIINGTYSTGFFVLATLFAFMGIGFIIINYLSKIKCIKEQGVNKSENECLMKELTKVDDK